MWLAEKSMDFARTGPDILRRFTPTPLVADLDAMGHTIRLQTNSPAILRQVGKAFHRFGSTLSGQEEFLWRLVGENDTGLHPPWPEPSGISVDGLHLLNIGQHSFFGVDQKARTGVGFVAEELVKDEVAFEKLFLAGLFTATAESLGLMAFSAACVALGEKGLVVVGPPQSGKTMCCFAATTRGLEFYSDQVVFLDSVGGELRAWGDFWPATFYPEATRIFPELEGSAQPLQCGEATFLCLDRNPFRVSEPRSIRPSCCALLTRSAERVAKITPLGRFEWEAIIRRNCLLRDGGHQGAEFGEVLRRLGSLPAYELAYEGDPASAVELFRSILDKAP
jgi:hypothetical protein